jgi:hypothetical protein
MGSEPLQALVGKWVQVTDGCLRRIVRARYVAGGQVELLVKLDEDALAYVQVVGRDPRCCLRPRQRCCARLGQRW